MTQATAQFELNFAAGLIDLFPSFNDCLSASVYSCGKPFKNIAADMDMSPSHLSRLLNVQQENMHFPAYRLPELIAVTGDKSPIYWLVEKFCQDTDAQAKQAVNEIAALLPKLQALVDRANPDETTDDPKQRAGQ